MKTDHQRRVEQFMMLAHQDLPAHPTLPNESILRLRATLILEEALETIQALGFAVKRDGDAHKYIVVPVYVPKLVDIVDGCADLSVVTVGTLSACGVADAPVLAAVDHNNLAKFGPGGYRRADGKWIKPPDHQPPDFTKILTDQGWVDA
jgi:predicted HAD superfamily Cof-like phosphohydrolase